MALCLEPGARLGCTTGVLPQEEVVFDSFGRVGQERRWMPGIGWSTREILYNGMGLKTGISEHTTGTATKWTQYLDYDAFGRPGTIRPPDGSTHHVTMSYTGNRVVKRSIKVGTSRSTGGTIVEEPQETIERYDRQQRLHEVVEPSGPGGEAVTTTYGYDVGNRLAKASTTAEGVTQVREFKYDNRGFPVSEMHPEKGPNHHGEVKFSKLDARGHIGNKIDTPNNLSYLFERAERLVRIRETSGQQRVLKSFTFGDANGTADWRNGKLSIANRYHYVSLLPSEPPGALESGCQSGDG